VPETIAIDGTDSAATVLGSVITDANGVWSYTPPTSLPSEVQAVVDANAGVLNLEAEAAGTAPDGTMLSGAQAVSVGVQTSSSTGLTAEAVAVNQAQAQAPAVVHVVSATAADAAPPTDAQAAQSDASIAEAQGSVDYQAPAWENDAGPSSTAYNPDVVNGTDYRSASVTPMSLFSSCLITSTVYKTTTVYTTVGEAHAYWDTKASFRYNATLSMSVGIKVSADGAYWSASGSRTLESQTGVSTGYANQGPYFGRQYQIPLRYVWVKRRHDCRPWPTIHYTYTTYEIDPVGYAIPPGGSPGRMGNNVADNDGYFKFYASNRAYRAVVQPNTFFALTRGRSITYGLAASVFGVAISAQAIYNSNHEQRIDAGSSRAATHDIWGARAPLDYTRGDPGVFYSW
jgi:hypothetical protein